MPIPADYIMLQPVVPFETGLGIGASCAEQSPGSLPFRFGVMDRRFGPLI